MLPISTIDSQVLRSIVGVFADFDETISTNGVLTSKAYLAMEKAQASKLLVVPVTGRSAGWCDHMARMWPIDGIIGENGGLYFRYDHKNKKLIKQMVLGNFNISKW